MKNKKQLGIYIHIPFCIQKCVYCDFLSKPANDKIKEQYVKALLKEIYATVAANHNELRNYQVETVFFGGGTPSCIDALFIKDIMSEIYKCFCVSEDAEITIECNPGTIDYKKAMLYRTSGINRISFGLQSANNEELKLLGRIHTFEQFEESLGIVKEAAFDNINVDIMSALPGQTVESYKETLEKVLALNVKHISAYSLIVEEGTPLSDNLQMYPQLPDEDMERQMYYITEDELAKAGYVHYEISNYAKMGYECRHNLSYWERKDYLGIGLGASSLFEGERYTNISDMNIYIDKAETFVKSECWTDEYKENCRKYLGNIRAEHYILTERDKMEEFMFLGLRKIEGVSEDEFSYAFDKDIWDVYGSALKSNIEKGLLKQNGSRIQLTDRGIDISNVVMAEFLFE